MARARRAGVIFSGRLPGQARMPRMAAPGMAAGSEAGRRPAAHERLPLAATVDDREEHHRWLAGGNPLQREVELNRVRGRRDRLPGDNYLAVDRHTGILELGEADADKSVVLVGIERRRLDRHLKLPAPGYRAGLDSRARGTGLGSVVVADQAGCLPTPAHGPASWVRKGHRKRLVWLGHAVATDRHRHGLAGLAG